MADTSPRMLSRSVPPAAEPLALAEAKLYLRVDGSGEDALITDMIAAVREAAEEYLRKSLVTQGWVLRYESYAPACVPLPKGPVQEVTQVKTVSRSGVETPVNPAMYHLAPSEDALHFDSVVLGHVVEIAYTAGYGDAEDVPASVKQGMLLHLAALYEDRPGAMEMPVAAVTLYKPHRAVRL